MNRGIPVKPVLHAAMAVPVSSLTMMNSTVCVQRVTLATAAKTKMPVSLDLAIIKVFADAQGPLDTFVSVSLVSVASTAKLRSHAAAPLASTADLASTSEGNATDVIALLSTGA